MKSTKTLLIVWLFALVWVLLGCAKTPSDDVNVVEETQDQNFVWTMQDLIKKEKPFICDVSYTDENWANIKGKVYSDWETKRTRSEMEVTVWEQTIKSFVIQDWDTTYLRSDWSDKGTKMTTKGNENDWDENDWDDNNWDNAVVEDWANNQAKMNFNCTKRDEDDSLLEVPNNVQFMDFSKELEKLMKK